MNETKLTVIDGETLMDMRLPPTRFCVQTLLPQDSRRSPAQAGSAGRGQAPERTSFAAGGKARDSSSAWTTASRAPV